MIMIDDDSKKQMKPHNRYIVEALEEVRDKYNKQADGTSKRAIERTYSENRRKLAHAMDEAMKMVFLVDCFERAQLAAERDRQ